jgi:hypothetical protein
MMNDTLEKVGLLVRTESITYPGLGKNVAWGGSIAFNFLSEIADEDP